MRLSLLVAACLLVPAVSPALSAGDGKEIDRAVNLRVQKKYAEAVSALKSLADRRAADPEVRSEALFQEGLVFEEAGKSADALAAYESVFTGYPGQPSAPYARLGWARTQVRLGDSKKALEGYDAVLRQYPHHAAEALLGIGEVRETQGKLGEAAGAMRSILRDFPMAPEAKQARDRLSSLCNRVVASPLTATAWDEVIGRGECLLDVGKPGDARKLYEDSIRRKPPPEWRVELLMGQGRVAVAEAKYGAADKSFRQAAKLAGKTPRAAEARMAIVQGFLDRNRLGDAVKELEGIVRDYPGTSQAIEAQLMAGSCYEVMRQWKKAEDAYRRVMEAAPQSPFAHEAQQSLMRLMEAKQ